MTTVTGIFVFLRRLGRGCRALTLKPFSTALFTGFHRQAFRIFHEHFLMSQLKNELQKARRNGETLAYGHMWACKYTFLEELRVKNNFRKKTIHPPLFSTSNYLINLIDLIFFFFFPFLGPYPSIWKFPG